MIKIRPIELRLALMNFLEFGVWGAYLISLGNFLYSSALKNKSDGSTPSKVSFRSSCRLS